MEKSFTDCEYSGRLKYERNTKLEHKFTDIHEKWDVSSSGYGHTYNIEIKDRDIPYTLYEHFGYILEKIKYDALMAAYEETGSIPIYLNFFQNNIGYYWDLRDLKPVWQKKWCTSTTAEGTYGDKREWKDVVLVYPNEGKQFRYV